MAKPNKEPKLKTETIDSEKAKAILQAENEQRAERCKAKIEEVLKEYKCDMEVGVFVTSKGNLPQVSIIPKN